MSKDAKGNGQGAPPPGNGGKAQKDQEKEVNAMFDLEMELRDKIRILDAVDRDAAGIRSCKQWSEVELASNGAAYSSFLLTMIREFTPRLSLVEMHQAKDLLYGLMINLLRFQDRRDLGPLAPWFPIGNMAAIKAATRILLDIPTDEGKLLAHYLEILDAFMRRRPQDLAIRKAWLMVLIDQLQLECDERFGGLRFVRVKLSPFVKYDETFTKQPLEFLSETLDQIVGKNVKGRGKKGIVGAAAELAIAVGAWGFDKLDSDPKVNLNAARDKLSQAQKNARKSKQTAPTFGKNWTIEEWEDFAKEQFDRLERAKSEARQKGLEDYRSYWRFAEAEKQHAIAVEQLDKLRNKRRHK